MTSNKELIQIYEPDMQIEENILTCLDEKDHERIQIKQFRAFVLSVTCHAAAEHQQKPMKLFEAPDFILLQQNTFFNLLTSTMLLVSRSNLLKKGLVY